MMKSARLALPAALVLASSFFVNPVNAQQRVQVIECDEGRWEGYRVGYNYGPTPEYPEYADEENSQAMEKTLIILMNERPRESDSATIVYDGITYDAKVIYSHYGRNNYVVLQYKPKDLIEIYTINIDNGDAILTIPKAIFGLAVDSFRKQCRVI